MKTTTEQDGKYGGRRKVENLFYQAIIKIKGFQKFMHVVAAKLIKIL